MPGVGSLVGILNASIGCMKIPVCDAGCTSEWPAESLAGGVSTSVLTLKVFFSLGVLTLEAPVNSDSC